MKRVAILLSLLLLLPLLGGCGATEEKQRFAAYEYRYFDTVTQVIGYADSKEEFDAVADRVFTMLEEYHEAFDIYYSYQTRHEGDPLASIRDVNRRVEAVDGTMTVTDTVYDLLSFSLEMYAATGGRTNVAMGAVLRLWHDCREDAAYDPASATIPSMDALTAAALHTDISAILLDPLKKTITVTDDKLTFDVGAIAKGYAAERIAEALLADGIEGYLLNLGGNVRVVGARPDGEPWQVGVENPDRTAEEAYVAILDVTDGAVVISGTYQRYYEVDGVRYHHIIDPDTLMPEDRYRSVAVVAADSGMGDAFSTALFNLDYEDGLALVENTDGVEALWVMPDGSLRHSSGFERYINDKN